MGREFGPWNVCLLGSGGFPRGLRYVCWSQMRPTLLLRCVCVCTSVCDHEYTHKPTNNHHTIMSITIQSCQSLPRIEPLSLSQHLFPSPRLMFHWQRPTSTFLVQHHKFLSMTEVHTSFNRGNISSIFLYHYYSFTPLSPVARVSHKPLKVWLQPLSIGKPIILCLYHFSS